MLLNKFVRILIAGLALMSSATASAQYSHIVLRGAKTVESHAMADIRDITFCGEDSIARMVVAFDDTTHLYQPGDIKSVTLGYGIPVIHINTADSSIYDVADKVNYLPATFNMRSNGYPGAADISDLGFNVRGRGNSTMTYPKKPYRLKFDKKQQLHSDMKKAKNFALIANYIDNTLMRNTMAFDLARLLEMPYTNHSIPVEVYFNDRYAGAYMLTEKVGINSGHMDDIDETKGIFFEMDLYFDEPYRFHSQYFDLPMMVKDPDFDELSEDGLLPIDPDQYLMEWAVDWNLMEAVLSGNTKGDIWDFVDLNSLVDYLLVYNVTNNTEIHHPKSIYVHKSERGTDVKYNFGSVWDFDWAYTFNGAEGSGLYNYMLFDKQTRDGIGSRFFRALIQQPGFAEAYAARWEQFKNDIYPVWRDNMDRYADNIEESALANFEIWPQDFADTPDPGLNGFRNAYNQTWSFLDQRIKFLDSAPNFGFFATSD